MNASSLRCVAQRLGRRSGVTLLLGVILATGCGQNDSRGTLTGPALVPASLNVSYLASIDSVAAAVSRLSVAAESISTASSPSTDQVAAARLAFQQARLAYKRVEFLTTYYEPSTSKSLNGPALPRVEEDEGPEAVFPPEGFQVLEELLWSDLAAAEDRNALAAETGNVKDLLTRLRRSAETQPITEDRLLDAMKLGIARLSVLGVVGFDSPVSLASIPEGIATLQGMRDAMATMRTRLGASTADSIDAVFAGAIATLEAAESFDALDRLDLIVTHLNPLARTIAAARDAATIGVPEERRAFRVSATTLFDVDAFDPQVFAPLNADSSTPERVELGRALFFDGRLSSDGARSCASCHLADRAYTDGLTRSAARTASGELRNAPTILNAGLQVGAFYDGRVVFLEDQVTDVVGNVEEMHGSLETSAALLRNDSGMRAAFAAAYPQRDSGTITPALIRHALATFIRAQSRLDSRVDRAFRGETELLTSEERLGLNLFMGKAKCATCHFMPITNGTVPPLFAESEVEVLGVPSTPVITRAKVDADRGRHHVTRAEPHRFAFRTPGVRNVAMTAPYMHNGVYRTLDQVVDFYNRGGGAGIGIELPNQTLPPDPLNLSTVEQRALVRFMEALTDTTEKRPRAGAR